MKGPWDDERKGREYVPNFDHKRLGVNFEDRSKVGWSGKYEACWPKTIIPLEKRNRDHQIEKKNCTRVNGCNNQNNRNVYYDKIGDKCPANDKIADFGGTRWKSCTNCDPPNYHEHDSPKINLPPLNNEV